MHVINIKFLENAFQLFYEGLHRYAFTILGDNDLAKDVAQQVFVTLWEKKDTLSINISVRAYLYRSVYHACINHKTRGTTHYSLYQEDPAILSAKPEFLNDVRELRAILDEAIASLPPQCKVIFLKSREEEKTYAVIARELHISVKTVEAQISKALKLLRAILEKHEILFYLILIFSHLPKQ
jgi:RNA polymerase sigma-70 factor, ECF subfamily